MEILRREEPPAVVERTQKLATLASELPPRVRLPLMDLALPALRRLSSSEYQRLKERVDQLTLADGRHSLFEFALRQALLQHLGSRFVPPGRRVVQIYALRGVIGETSCVLSLLARAGHRGEEQAQAAFARGRLILREPGADPEFLPVAECAPSRLSQALEALAVTSPLIKRKLLAACLECLIHDGTITTEEIELFRGVADALGCPVPPWAAAASPPP
jgi:hypothetical protein